jgi:poly-gamma-glutamate synthesis protein (capsule biosynthesis protein)
VTLGFGQPVHRRGRPELASAADGERILKELAELSRGFGTTVEMAGRTGRIVLG